MRAQLLAVLALLVWNGKGGDSITLRLENHENGPVLEWHSQMQLPMAGTLPQYKIEWSPDLKTWQLVGNPIRGGIGADDEVIRQSVTAPPGLGFYRLSAGVDIAQDDNTHPASIFGYAKEFSRNLQQAPQLPLDEFVRRYTPTNKYRAGISFDVTTARYWDEFNADIGAYNQTHTNDMRLTDFRLNADELAIFKTNGFVVSERLGSYSFADGFYKVFIDDLPVYISSDAMLHAWHRNFVAILAEVETSFLEARLGELITNMSAQVPALNAEAVGTPLENGVLDADYYLAVANSLLSGTNDPGHLGQSARVNQALAAVESLQPQDFEVFGAIRKIDFSQFTVRGHYGDNPFLQNYFRAMMWCGLIDFQFRGTNAESVRAFAGAAALTLLLERSNSAQKWDEYDQVIRNFVGFADSMNVGQLGDLLRAGGLAAPFDQLPEIYSQLWNGEIGVQNIRSGYRFSPLGPEQLKLPRSFALMPQRFIIDSWAFSQVVFDSIIWDENGIPEFSDKVMRRIPSGLDVAFSIFGNNQITPEIVARIANQNGRLWRDGLPYQQNLAAVRMCIDEHTAEFWTNNIYASWLNCLRALSDPLTPPEFPQAMQTRSFALNSLNTQLASWSELRHDTVLYAKQSSTAMVLCEYPYAYVEPRPEFWRKLAGMSERTRALLEAVPNVGMKFIVTNWGTGTWLGYSTEALKTNWLPFYERFTAAANMLAGIAEKEVDHVDLDADEVEFLQDTIQQHRAYVPRGSRTYDGWYPRLYYKPLEHTLDFGIWEGSDMWSPVVTDVHTDPSDAYSGDPGCILHEGVGNVNMAFIVVDCGETPMMYAGPVMSHYEFEQSATTRLTDAQWRETLKNKQQPQSPDWTKSFLVPAPINLPQGIY